MKFEVSAPRSGQYVLAGWCEGATGLVFFRTTQDALDWLTDPRHPYEQVPGRKVVSILFADVVEQKVVFPPPPYFEDAQEETGD